MDSGSVTGVLTGGSVKEPIGSWTSGSVHEQIGSWSSTSLNSPIASGPFTTEVDADERALAS